MPISLVLDIIIAVLLVLTIAYAVRLNQRLSQLRSDKNELQKLAKTFADATVRAETGIQNLKISSEALQDQVKRAEVLKDDLTYLLERGTRTADEMVETVRKPGVAQAKPAQGQAMARPLDRPLDRPGNRKASMGGAAQPQSDPEARLIEEAIRAATPDSGPNGGTGKSRGTRADMGRESDIVTRRISGQGPSAARHLGGADPAQGAPRTSTQLGPQSGDKPQGRPGTLASRGLHVAEDDDAIGDTEAARELLKALSSVK